ncbi:hypothetical protein F5880DRAFT_1459829, partial [Lentinula raphanica]
MIGRCRAKCWIIQLKEEQSLSVSESTQRGVKGNIVIYPQKVSQVATVLPPTLDELAAPICVVFVGSRRPSQDWLRKHAKPLAICPSRVRRALIWLKEHNHLYRNIQIDHALLDTLPEDFVLPVHVEHVLPSTALDSVTSGYTPDLHNHSNETLPPITDDRSFVITDVDGSATSNEMRAAAVRHVQNNGGFLEFSHDIEPVNEFFNPSLFPMLYPTLFPYGIGGFENVHRSARVSLKRQVRH